MASKTSRNPEEFSAFELAGWDENIVGYDQAFGAVTRQTVAPLLDDAGVQAGSRVLDVCCGPGMLAAGALARGAQAVGVDFSAEAVALAVRNVPGGRFEQGDAQALPFADASFDAVLCGYGLMHLPNPMAALGETLRVLRPGGRAAFSVWDAAGNGFPLVYEAVRACGNLDMPLPHGPDFFLFGTLPSMQAALTETGFKDVAARQFDQPWRLEQPEQYVAAILNGTVRARAVLAAQNAADMVRVRAYIAEYLLRFRDATGAIAVPMPAIIGRGVRR